MTPIKIPPELKKITQFVRRAEELDHDTVNKESRVVAYYCRQHAVQYGITLSSSPTAKKCLSSILNQLEGEKAAMSVFNRVESKLICRQFADKIFKKADDEDRAGVAGKDTAKTFYAAATFFEILTQFHDKKEKGDELEADEDKDPVEAEEDEKRVYCKWKATEILKAVREGRKPTPGGFGEDFEDAQVENGGDDTNDNGGDGNIRKMENEDNDGSSLPPPSAPSGLPPPNLPPPLSAPSTQDDDDHDDEATEVEIGLDGTASVSPPPPAYPGNSNDFDDDAVQNGHFQNGDVYVPPPALPEHDAEDLGGDDDDGDDGDDDNGGVDSLPVVPTAPTPALPPPTSPARRNKMSSAVSSWGFGKKKNGKKPSKQMIADATELTRFGLAALEESDVDLAVSRLKEALSTLGR